MKRLLASGLMLGLLSGAALAQTTMPLPPTGGPIPNAEAAPQPPGAPDAPAMKVSPPAGPDAADDGDAGGPPPPHKGHGKKADDDSGPPPGDARGHRPPPPSRAARFRIETGEATLDIKCAEEEPMQVCADLTLRMLDRLQAAPSR